MFWFFEFVWDFLRFFEIFYGPEKYAIQNPVSQNHVWKTTLEKFWDILRFFDIFFDMRFFNQNGSIVLF